MSDELTVEQALKELREKLPLGALSIRADITESGIIHIVIYSAYLDTVPYAPTLNEAMSQVRAFKQSQEQER